MIRVVKLINKIITQIQTKKIIKLSLSLSLLIYLRVNIITHHGNSNEGPTWQHERDRVE